jgi:hypothetical protein
VGPVGRPRRGQRGSGPLQGENLIELVAYHHAIGILSALVLAPIGRVEDRPDEINQGLERTLGSVKRLVEKAGAAGT